MQQRGLRNACRTPYSLFMQPLYRTDSVRPCIREYARVIGEIAPIPGQTIDRKKTYFE